MSRCTPQPGRQHRRRICDTQRGQGESRIRSGEGTGHWGPWEALGENKIDCNFDNRSKKHVLTEIESVAAVNVEVVVTRLPLS